MHVRSYLPRDNDALADLFRRSVQELAVGLYDQRQRDAWAPQEPDPERFRDRFESMHVLIAESDDAGNGEVEPMGFIGYEDDGHIDFLYTSPEHVRCGVATRLHDAAVAELAAMGVSELFTEASEVARPFFERQGYSVLEQELVERDGVSLPRFRMRRGS